MAPGASMPGPEPDAIPVVPRVAAEGAREVLASPGWQPDACLLLMKLNSVNY